MPGVRAAATKCAVKAARRHLAALARRLAVADVRLMVGLAGLGAASAAPAHRTPWLKRCHDRKPLLCSVTSDLLFAVLHKDPFHIRVNFALLSQHGEASDNLPVRAEADVQGKAWFAPIAIDLSLQEPDDRRALLTIEVEHRQREIEPALRA